MYTSNMLPAHNFADENRGMMNIEEQISQEEVVRYIADRHHQSVQDVISRFLPAENHLQESALEENEKEIIRELIRRKCR